MECLAGSIGVAYSDAEPKIILTADKIFPCMFFLSRAQSCKVFFFSLHTLSLHINCTTFSTGEHIVALYIGILTIEIKCLFRIRFLNLTCLTHLSLW